MKNDLKTAPFPYRLPGPTQPRTRKTRTREVRDLFEVKTLTLVTLEFFHVMFMILERTVVVPR